MKDELIKLIFPNVKDKSYYEEKYPKRDLKEGAVVTRFAPSPTGFVHMGSLFSAYVSSKAAHDTDGVFFLRIEDTDQKREVENGIENIIRDLDNFDIKIDEGVTSNGEVGIYGPYIQTHRKEIYESFASYLMSIDLAYPCFLTEKELEEMREIQEKDKLEIGCYGAFAKYRDLSDEERIKKIKNGEPYIIRLKSQGDINKRIHIKDLIKGDLEFPENNIDVVLIKGDGFPTYHFAHAVDDSLMHTTHVIRGDEWLSSLPIHYELFKVLGYKLPKYCHLSPIMIQDGEIRRKLSKRKDKEAAISFYHELGVPKEAIKLYLLTIANSNFEEWYNANPRESIDKFKFDFKKVSSSGSLFDMEKLLNISKNYLSYLSASDFYNRLLEYTKEYDSEFYNLLVKYKDDSIEFINIERERKKPRKDYSSFSEVKDNMWYMFDELFFKEKKSLDNSEIIIDYFNNYYDSSDTEEEWFNKMKDLASKYGYATDMKAYKEEPDSYPGSIVDISNMIRISMTTKDNTPNLYNILKILGKTRIEKRINEYYPSSKKD
ncbi:MAG: glutamate--tRNA ligase [Bacilli bacterium]|nr:glutamate--tRNA ligase [Bacilli bacterium]